MADGSGRAGASIPRFTIWQAQQVEVAARRVARMFGTGGGWQAPVAYYAVEDADAGGDRLNIAWRGHREEDAARRLRGVTVCVRRFHAWALQRGVVTIPHGNPDVAGMAAVSFARLSGPEWPLLRAYACEDFTAWCRVEPFLWRALPSRNQVHAGRDAMARMIYGRAATAMDVRARDLGMRAADYRTETRGAERVLRHWLVQASVRLNRCANWNPPPLGACQGKAHRVETWWRSEHEHKRKVSRDGNTPAKRHK